MCESRKSFSLSCRMIYDLHISVKFACKSFMNVYLFCFLFISIFTEILVSGFPTTTTTKQLGLMMYRAISKRVLRIAKITCGKLLDRGFWYKALKLIEKIYQFEDTYNFRRQVDKMQIEIYVMNLTWFSKIYSLLSLLLIFIEHQSHCSSEIIPERKITVILTKHKDLPMIIMDHHRNCVIKLLIITNINSSTWYNNTTSSFQNISWYGGSV